jgi:hypothetical protein
MTRILYDGINTDAHLIPANAQMVAGYVDGLYAWSDADWARFPNAVKIRIAVFADTNDGHVLDCEPGNNTPAESVDWVLMRRKAGVEPTVYCGRNTWWPQIRAAFAARAVPEPHYWVADYSTGQQIPSGAIALQYADMGSYDLSVVADYWPGVDPAPTPAPLQEDPVAYLLDVQPDPNNKSVNQGIWRLEGNLLFHVLPDAIATFRSWGDKEGPISFGQFETIKAAIAAMNPAVSVTVDGTQLAAAVKAALSDAGLLAAQGAAIAHAEAVQEHNDTPAN